MGADFVRLGHDHQQSPAGLGINAMKWACWLEEITSLGRGGLGGWNLISKQWPSYAWGDD